MLYSGLVSITFRQLLPEAICELVAQAGLEGIEWGGNGHVPHGDLATAQEVARLTREAGLQVASYGSYYRAGTDEPPTFDQVLRTAVALGAPLIRVWAGRKGSAAADDAYRRQVTQDASRIAQEAAGQGIAVAFEFHGNTLTDTPASTVRLLQEANHPNLGTYWQAGSEDAPGRLEGLQAVLPWLANVHVNGGGEHRGPLARGAAPWARDLAVIAAMPGDRWAMLEFVQGDAPENLLRDAATLKAWLDGAQA